MPSTGRADSVVAVPVARRLTENQLARRQAILDAAFELAEDVPYEKFTTRGVAARAGVSLGTLYHYFATKDHLIVEATLRWSAEFEADLVAEPIVGRTPRARVMALLRRQAERAAAHRNLHRSLTAAYFSPDPSVDPYRLEHWRFTSRSLDTAIGRAALPDRQAAIDLIAGLILSTLPGGVDRILHDEQWARRVEAAVRHCLRPA